VQVYLRFDLVYLIQYLVLECSTPPGLMPYLYLGGIFLAGIGVLYTVVVTVGVLQRGSKVLRRLLG